MDKPDMDLLIKCAIEAGASVTIADNGNGGIYINGKKITDVKKLLEDFFNDMKPCYGLCERCVWYRNGGCSEWNGMAEECE